MGEDPLVAKAFDKDKHLELAKAIEKLSSDEATYFLAKLEIAIKKRKIQITGYLVAMGVWVVAMVFALAYFGTHDGFVGWVFLAPFALVGIVLYIFGQVTTKLDQLTLGDKPPASPPKG